LLPNLPQSGPDPGRASKLPRPGFPKLYVDSKSGVVQTPGLASALYQCDATEFPDCVFYPTGRQPRFFTTILKGAPSLSGFHGQPRTGPLEDTNLTDKSFTGTGERTYVFWGHHSTPPQSGMAFDCRAWPFQGVGVELKYWRAMMAQYLKPEPSSTSAPGLPYNTTIQSSTKPSIWSDYQNASPPQAQTRTRGL